MRCKSCGAPMQGKICEYCGTDGKSITATVGGEYITIPIHGEPVKFYIENAEALSMCDKPFRDEHGHIKMPKARYIYKLTLISTKPIEI